MSEDCLYCLKKWEGLRLQVYQSVKMMSRLMKWTVFFLFLLILDFVRLMDAINKVIVHFKQWLSKI
ncbi:hypothetical protein [Bartonella florencae]|uniref:hypothetical protein n=1 Tax=Bartonella florencae TaxID=928210 RepID=UPI000A0001F2